MTTALKFPSVDAMAERWLPIAAAVLTLLICSVWKNPITNAFVQHKLSLPQLYVAVFGWASVQTSALLAVYGIVVTKSDGFIASVKHTKPMRHFYAYSARAIVLGFVLTVATIPLLVTNYEMKDIEAASYAITSVWFALFVWAFLALARVGWLFTLLIRVPDVQHIPG